MRWRAEYDKVMHPIKTRYLERLIAFYSSNPTYRNPDFEDAEVRRTLRIVRLLYYTRIFRYAGRKLRERIKVRVERLVAKVYRWMHLQGSAMCVEHPEPQTYNPFTDPLDTDNTKE